uniref:Uncharacterized protein n=1 Tax=Pyxicephalus adspersus TaxID=30357 RepID=A0AAV3B0F9_PYXAD|nr:TPA: hypothetical protein GDO54_001413 [Pyxicephalus adspersus]
MCSYIADCGEEKRELLGFWRVAVLLFHHLADKQKKVWSPRTQSLVCRPVTISMCTKKWYAPRMLADAWGVPIPSSIHILEKCHRRAQVN